MEIANHKPQENVSFKDLLSLDQRLMPLLGGHEKAGAHLRLLYTMSHSALTLGEDHPRVYTANQYRAFLFLSEHKDDPFNVDFILNLHRALTGEEGGRWKGRNTYFDFPDGGFYVTTSAEKTPEVMEALMEKYSYLNAPTEDEFEGIFEFVLHFLCVHPFLDGNGRMSSFLLQFLLYKAGLKTAIYLPIDALLTGLNATRTSVEIRRATGSFYGMKEPVLDSFIPYMKSLIKKSYCLMIESLED